MRNGFHVREQLLKLACTLVLCLPIVACDSPAPVVPPAPEATKAEPLSGQTATTDSDFLMTPAAKAAKNKAAGK